MARGGSREGAGRPAGAASRMNEEARKAAAEGGILPLDYMLAILRDDTQEAAIRMDAAKSAAPYVHAKLASVEHSGSMEIASVTKEQRDAAVAAATRANG